MYLYYLVAFISVIFLLIVGLVVLRARKSERNTEALLQQVAKIEEKLAQQQTNQRRIEEMLTELRSGFYGLSDKVKFLQQHQSQERSFVESSVESLSAKFQELESSDPGSRLYSKAAKLIASGGTIEDVMMECDLPRAEAELMMNLHANQPGN